MKSSRPRVPFVVFDATGHILRWGLCGDSMVEAQATEPGEQAMATTYEVTEELAAGPRADRDAMWDKDADPPVIVTPEYVAPRPYKVDLSDVSIVRVT